MRVQCPESAALVDLVDNVLPQAEADAVARHLAGCELCSREVEVLRKSLEPQVPETADAGSESRMRERFRRFLLRQGGATTHRPEPRHYLVAALAAGVLILLYPAYVGLKQIMPQLSPGEPAVHIVRLDPPTRDANAVAPLIRPDKRVEYLGLMFFVPLVERQPAKLDCRLLLGGRVVHATKNLASFDGLGNFLLLIPHNSLPAGRDYLLTVSAPDNTALSWQFPFGLETPVP